MSSLSDLFARQGGTFHTPEEDFAKKLQSVRAFIFDWDGVFNTGTKFNQYGSPFSEIDAMGTNLLRFAHFLSTGEIPVVAIISGEINEQARTLGSREHFHALYLHAKNKVQAFEHLLDTQHLEPHQVAFVFDDVLDLSIAHMCALRIMVGRPGSPVFERYVVERNLVDYTSAQGGASHAVREVCELLIGLMHEPDVVFDHRVQFSDKYRNYLTQRERISTHAYTLAAGHVSPYQ